MKKNALARKILCGLLAAGVVGACGSALAASYLDATSEDKTINNDINAIFSNNDRSVLGIDARKGHTARINASTIDLTVNGLGAKQNAWGVYTFSNKDDNLGGGNVFLGKENSIININVNADAFAMGLQSAGNPNKVGSYVEVNGKELNVITHSNTSWTYGLNIANNSTADTIGSGTRATMVINTDKTYINASTDASPNDAASCGIVVMSQGNLEINSDLEVHADRAIATRGDSIVNINTDGKHSTKLNGDIYFTYDEKTSGTKIDAQLNVNLTGSDSVWNGNSVVEWGLKDNTSTSYDKLKEEGKLEVRTFDLKIADGAQWNPTTIESTNSGKDGVANIALNNVTLNNGIINLDESKLAGEDALQIENIKGTGGIINTNSVDNTMVITQSKADETKLVVNGTKEVTDAIASGQANLQQLANVVTSKDDENKSLASTVTSEANDIIGGYSAEVGENGKIVAGSEKTVENTTNRAISDMASISLMTWRQENNDMNKRLGELRDSKGEHGAWARMARGESKYGAQNVKNQYNYYQVGYDEKLSVNPNWTVGVALTRTEGNSTFATGSGENKHTGFAVYGSYLADNGSFIDLIAKYARMDNDYKTIGAGVGDADYETNGYSLSAEYGKRFTKDNGFWIEPQVELTYGKVGSASYTTSKGANVYQDGVDSLVGRLGFSLGKDIKQGNVYVRASYLYDFDGETTAYMSKAGAGATKFEQDLGGGWWEVGVGTNLNLSDATHLYFDVEKTYGGNVATPWQWNAGVRWSF